MTGLADNGHPSGGVLGCTIGVSDMKTALALYADVLGFDQVLSDTTGVQNDWTHLPHGGESFRRVRLTTVRAWCRGIRSTYRTDLHRISSSTGPEGNIHL